MGRLPLGPLASRDASGGLVDSEGCFWPTVEAAAGQLNLIGAAVAEMRSQ